MKRKMTMKLPDGRTITHEMDDEGAAIHKNVLQMQNQGPDAKTSYMELLKKKQGGQGNAPAMMGRGGDDRLAHVNGYEDLLLRLMGGSGSTNPRTGMKEYAMFGKKNYGNEIYTEPTQQLPYEGVGAFPDAPMASAAVPAGPVYLNTYGGVSNPALTPELTQTAPPIYNQGSVPQTAPTNILGLAPGVTATPKDFTRFLGGTPEVSAAPVYNPSMNMTANVLPSTAPPVYQAPQPVAEQVQPAGQLPFTAKIDDPIAAYWARGGPMNEQDYNQLRTAFRSNPEFADDYATYIQKQTAQYGTRGNPSSAGQTKNDWKSGFLQTGALTPKQTQNLLNPPPQDTTQPVFTLPTQQNQAGNVNQPPVTGTQPPPGNTVNLDPNLKPFSISGSQSRSGLPDTYQDRLLKTLFPQLESSITNMGANYDQYTNQALGSYQQMMQNALRKNIPAAIANLANRGIINSTEGQKVLGNVYSSAAEDAANKGYQTAMQSAFLKANMPTVLSQIAQLGQGTRSNQFAYQEDPTVMQRSLIDLFRSMQG